MKLPEDSKDLNISVGISDGSAVTVALNTEITSNQHSEFKMNEKPNNSQSFIFSFETTKEKTEPQDVEPLLYSVTLPPG